MFTMMLMSMILTVHVDGNYFDEKQNRRKKESESVQ